jgi:glyoxylase-like metal-dependent hydrolase (beta-lactamase superfamily II)
MSLLRVSIAVAAVWSLADAGAALAQGPVPTPPEAKAFRLGALQITSLHDANFVAPNDGKVFGLNAGAQAVAEVLKDAGAPTDSIALSVNDLLVRMPGRLVLIDTGLGPKLHGGLAQSLAAAGVSPAEVTDVLITHAHGDHVGGLLDAAGQPAFPKASIRMSAKEWDWMQSQAGAKALVAAIAAQVKPFEPGAELLPGITPVALYGHTPGHVVYVIASRGQKLEDIGDAAHSSIISLGRPDWTVQFDGDKAGGAAARRAELTRLAAAHWLVFAPHFPYPGVGRIEARGDGFVWRPELPAPGPGRESR